MVRRQSPEWLFFCSFLGEKSMSFSENARIHRFDDFSALQGKNLLSAAVPKKTQQANAYTT